MPMFFFVWIQSTVEHLAEHDVTPDEFEFVVQNPERRASVEVLDVPMRLQSPTKAASYFVFTSSSTK